MKDKDIKLIAFDLDGTLVDAYQAVYESLKYAFAQVGLDIVDHQTVKRKVGHGETQLIKSLVAEDKVEQVLSIYRQHHRSALKSGTKLLPGAKDALDFCKSRGYLLAIASNRPSRFTHIILKHLQIKDYFDAVVCADQVDNPKPAGDLITYLLKKFSLRADQAVYVGDMTIDIQAGKAANVATVAVLTGSNHRQEIEVFEPHYIMEGMIEFKGLWAD